MLFLSQSFHIPPRVRNSQRQAGGETINNLLLGQYVFSDQADTLSQLDISSIRIFNQGKCFFFVKMFKTSEVEQGQ